MLVLAVRRYPCIAGNHGRFVEGSRRGARSVGDYSILSFDIDTPAPRYRASHRAMRGHITDEEMEALAQYYASIPH
jgi:hypothetical protein